MAELWVDAHFDFEGTPQDGGVMDVRRLPCVSMKLLVSDTVVISWGTDRVDVEPHSWNKWLHIHGSDRRGPHELGRMVRYDSQLEVEQSRRHPILNGR